MRIYVDGVEASARLVQRAPTWSSFRDLRLGRAAAPRPASPSATCRARSTSQRSTRPRSRGHGARALQRRQAVGAKAARRARPLVGCEHERRDRRHARRARARPRPACGPGSAPWRARPTRGRWPGLTTLFAVLVAMSWRKWGTPEIDAGAELTTAAQAVHGHLPYEDVRYFYGPLGNLRAAGRLQALRHHADRRLRLGPRPDRWRSSSPSTRSRARPSRRSPPACRPRVLLAIGFSGTQFNFVLPHTNSATFGLLLLLLELLAPRARPAAAGQRGRRAGGCSRGWSSPPPPGSPASPGWSAPGAQKGAARPCGSPSCSSGRRSSSRSSRSACSRRRSARPPVLAEPLAGRLPEGRGLQRLSRVDPVRRGASVASTAARARSTWRCSPASSPARCGCPAPAGSAASRPCGRCWPPSCSSALVDAAWRVAGSSPTPRDAVQTESRQLLIGMSWLPALSLGAAAIVAWRFLRRRDPLSARWPLDLSIAAAALMLTARALTTSSP